MSEQQLADLVTRELDDRHRISKTPGAPS